MLASNCCAVAKIPLLFTANRLIDLLMLRSRDIKILFCFEKENMHTIKSGGSINALGNINNAQRVEFGGQALGGQVLAVI